MSGPSDPHAALKGCIRFCPSRFLENRIEFGVHLSSLAATKLDAGNPASAERSMDSAEKAYQTVDRFLSDPKHSAGLTVDEIQDMREELQRLRDRLDAVAQRFKK